MLALSVQLTEVCHTAHFWESHGRCAMPGIPMRQLVGLSGDKQTSLHVELPLMSQQVMLNTWTSTTDGHITKNAHKPFLGDSVMHDLCTTNSASAQVP